MLSRCIKIMLSIFVMVFVITIGGNAMANENLTVKEKNIVFVSSYAASGDLDNLNSAVKKSLEQGLTINEAKEIFVQLYAYCGFPRSLNALSVLLEVSGNGNYEVGIEGISLPKNADKNSIGTKTQTELAGAPVVGALFQFAPAIDDYLKEHLFGDIFARGVLSNQEREIVTIAALSTMDNVEPQLNAHIQIGLNTGLTESKIDEILKITSQLKPVSFGKGDPNDAFAKYFKGQSYLKILTKDGVVTANVTFEPKCRNNWHIHHKGGQILLVTEGRGYYQEWGKPARELHVGDVVNIPAETKHWHGAAFNSWFTHIAIEVPSEGSSTEWLEEVSDEEYDKLR